MPRRAPPVALALAVLVLVAGGIAVATASPVPVSVYGRPAANRGRGHAAAVALLAALRPPRGARRSADVSPLLDEPGYEAVTPNLVDAHRFLTTALTPAAVIAQVAGHLPPGVIRHDGESQPGPTVSERDWELAPTAGLAQRIVAVTAVALPGGRTLVRLDGEAVWLSPRPVDSRIDAADVTGGSFTGEGPLSDGRAGPASRPVRLGAAAARTVTAALNGDELAQPGTVACPAQTAESITVRLRTRGRRLAGAIEQITGCAAVTLTLAGRSSVTLADGAPAGRNLADALVTARAIHRCARRQLIRGPARQVRDRSRVICAVGAVRSPTLLFPGAGSRRLPR